MATLQPFHFTVKQQKKEANRKLKRVQRGTAGELSFSACADFFLF